MGRLGAGPAPRGEAFDLARRVLAAAPAAPEAGAALRLLLEGAVADTRTGVEDTQAVMAILKALDRGVVRASDLVPPP